MFKFLQVKLKNNCGLFKFLYLTIQKCHFMFSWRYWSHIQYLIVNSRFWKILIPYLKIFKNYHFMCFCRSWSHLQDFQKNIRRIFRICRVPSFPTLSKFSISKILRFPKWILFWNDLVLFLVLIRMSWWVRNYKELVWESWSRPEVRKWWKWWVLGFFQSEIEKLLIQNEAE